MEIKKYVVYGMFIAVIIVLFSLLYGATASSNKSTFNTYLSSSKYVYLIMDGDGASSPVFRNIMQCGVDFAGSLGATKILNVYAISKDGTCYYSIYNTTKYICLNDIGNVESDPIIYVKYGHNSTYQGNIAYVGVDETFVDGDCSIVQRLSK